MTPRQHFLALHKAVLLDKDGEWAWYADGGEGTKLDVEV